MQQDEIEMVRRLAAALEERLASVVAYGPAVLHEPSPAPPYLLPPYLLPPYLLPPYLLPPYLLIVVFDLEPDTLRRLREPVRWWLHGGRPWPRLFTPELLRASADVFPIELVDLTARHRVVYGDDPITGLLVEPAHLRLQLERELREKLMRLREGYVECHGRAAVRELEQLLAASYASFVRIFRGALHALGAPRSETDAQVVETLCAWLDLPPEPFDAVARIARGEHARDPEAIFASYYRALSAAEARIDRWLDQPPRSEP